MSTRVSPTQVFKLEADDNIKHQLFQLICNQYSRKNFQNRDVIPYDPVIEKKATHKIIYVDSYKVIQNTIKDILNSDNVIDTTKGIDESQFSDYMIQFEIDNVRYCAIGGFSTVKKIKKLAIFGNLTDNKLKNLSKDDIVGLNGDIHSMIIGDSQILIHSVQGFERVFELKKVFSSEAKKTLDEPYFKSNISNGVLEQLSKNIGTGGRMARRLTKLRNDPGRNMDFFNNKNGMKKIINNPKHPNKSKFPDVTLNPDTEKLCVPIGKEEQLINFISDGSYVAEVSKHSGFDGAR